MARKKKRTVALAEIPEETATVKTSKRPKQNEMPLKGYGVEIITDKTLIELGDKFIDIRDTKAELVTQFTKTEGAILDRMAILGLERFRFGDQLAVLSTGKKHIKIKTVKNEGLPDADTQAITDEGA